MLHIFKLLNVNPDEKLGAVLITLEPMKLSLFVYTHVKRDAS